MRVTSKGQVTIPLEVREAMGILPAETEVEFCQDTQGRWYLKKTEPGAAIESRFRKAHTAGKPLMSTEEILQLTRS